MEFQTVMQTRRSVRSFARKDIPEEALRRILEAARVAPSACNFQPWRFIVVKDAAMKAKLAAASKGQSSVAAAAVVIVCCGKKYKNPYNWMGPVLYLVDVAIAIDHMTLAARNEGIGSVWIGAFDQEPIRKLLAIPADHDVVMLLPLGYPAGGEAFHTTTERLPLEQVAYRERFGEPMLEDR
jgi:nitroreductase